MLSFAKDGAQIPVPIPVPVARRGRRRTSVHRNKVVKGLKCHSVFQESHQYKGANTHAHGEPSAPLSTGLAREAPTSRAGAAVREPGRPPSLTTMFGGWAPVGRDGLWAGMFAARNSKLNTQHSTLKQCSRKQCTFRTPSSAMIHDLRYITRYTQSAADDTQSAIDA